MNYRRQHTSAPLPLLATPNVELFALDKRSQSDIQGSPFYFLQCVRNGVLANLESGAGGENLQATARTLREDYNRRVPIFASDLAEFVTSSCSDGFDALASVPTNRESLILPYCEAFIGCYPYALKLTGNLVRGESWDSSKEISIDECIRAVHFKQEPPTKGPARVLVIDDVLASGKSAAVVIEFLRRYFNPPPMHFAVACPLWISSGTS